MVLVVLIIKLAVLELGELFGSPPYAASTTTAPAVAPVIVTVQTPLERVQVVETKLTEPVPLVWDHVTVPVGMLYPLTLTLQVIFVEEPATAEVGLQETVVVEGFFFTVRPKVPKEDGFFLSPE